MARIATWEIAPSQSLASKRAQLVEMRKRLLVQFKAHEKLGTDGIFTEADAEMRALLDQRIGKLEDQIAQTIDEDQGLAQTAGILRSVPGIGPVASTMLIPEMPELGQLSGEQAAALTGLAPIAHDSSAMREKRAIGGGRRQVRRVMFRAALVASHKNPQLKIFADRLRDAGKTHKVIITAVARKLVTIVNALLKSR